MHIHRENNSKILIFHFQSVTGIQLSLFVYS